MLVLCGSNRNTLDGQEKLFSHECSAPDNVRIKENTKILISSPNTTELPLIRIVFSRRF